MKKNKNKKIDLLIVIPCELEILKDVNLVTNYPEMKCFFVINELKKMKTNKNILIISDSKIWTEKSRSKFDDFCNLLLLNNINIDNIENILFAGLGALKKFKGSKNQEHSLKRLTESFNKIYKWEDKNIRNFSNSNIYTIGHFTDITCSTDNYFDADLTVSNLFNSRKNWNNNNLIVHIDHNLKNRYNNFEDIKNILFNIEREVQKHEHWQSLEIYYHDKKITNIDNIGHDNYGKLKITQLAELYGKTHIAFLSHKETLGQYPLELIASGATLITKGKFFPFDAKKKDINFIDLDKEKIDYNKLLDLKNLKSTCDYNMKSMKRFGFDKFLLKNLQFIFADLECK